MDRRHVLETIGAGLVGGTAGCLAGDRRPTRVRMVGLEFRPARVSVGVGATVEWVNESDIAHTVTAYEGELPPGAAYFASGDFGSEAAARRNLAGGLVEPGGSYSHPFESTGDHPYFCIPHEGSGMTGVVDVG